MEHRLPCLALQFDPLVHDLLFYVERYRRLHAAARVSQQVTLWRLVQNQTLVPDGGASQAAVTSPPPPPPPLPFTSLYLGEH